MNLLSTVMIAFKKKITINYFILLPGAKRTKDTSVFDVHCTFHNYDIVDRI